MPKPNTGETQKDFVTRCVPAVIADGTAADPANAALLLNNLWINHEREQMSANTAEADITWLDAEVRRKGQYRKDVIKVGRFVHPRTGKDVSVSAERLKHWQQSFHEMQAAGINIPIRNGHDGDAIGHIAGATVAGEKMEMLHDFPDDGAVTIAKRNRFVSIGVVPTYTDAHGNTWKDVIDHVASTPVPVITGQDEFIALSRETAAPAAQPKEPTMEGLNELLGLPVDADETAIKAKVTELAARPEKKAEPVEAPAVLSQDSLDAFTDLNTTKLDMLQKDGKINKACRDKLALALIGTPEAPNVFCLSRVSSGTDRSIAALVVDALNDNVLVKDGETTAAQLPAGSVALDRTEPETEEVKLAREKKEDVDKKKYDLLSLNKPENRTDDANAFVAKYESSHKED